MWKHRSTVAVNILGFTIGLFCVSYLYFLIRAELTTDQFIGNQENIYRLKRLAPGYEIGITSAPFGENLKIKFPDAITSYCRINSMGRQVEYDGKKVQRKASSLLIKLFSTCSAIRWSVAHLLMCLICPAMW